MSHSTNKSQKSYFIQFLTQCLILHQLLITPSSSYKVRILHKSPNALNGDRRGTYCLWSKVPLEHLMLSLDIKVQDAYTGEVYFNNVATEETWILKAIGDYRLLPEKFYKVLTEPYPICQLETRQIWLNPNEAYGENGGYLLGKPDRTWKKRIPGGTTLVFRVTLVRYVEVCSNYKNRDSTTHFFNNQFLGNINPNRTSTTGKFLNALGKLNSSSLQTWRRDLRFIKTVQTQFVTGSNGDANKFSDNNFRECICDIDDIKKYKSGNSEFINYCEQKKSPKTLVESKCTPSPCEAGGICYADSNLNRGLQQNCHCKAKRFGQTCQFRLVDNNNAFFGLEGEL